MAPFLAGSRRSFRRISKSYLWLSRASILIDGNHHGYIKKLRQRQSKLSQNACQKFGSISTALIRNLKSYIIEGFENIKISIYEAKDRILNWLARRWNRLLAVGNTSNIASESIVMAQNSISELILNSGLKLDQPQQPQRRFEGLNKVRKKMACAYSKFSRFLVNTFKTGQTDETDAIKTSFISKESSSLSSFDLLTQS